MTDGPIEEPGAERGSGGEARFPYPGLLRTVGLLGAVVVLGGLFFQATYFLFPAWPDIARMAVPTQLALAVVAAWAVVRSDRPWREALGFRPLEARNVPPLLLVMIGSVTVFSEIYVVIQRFVPVPAEFEAMLRDLLELTNPADSLATLVIAILIAPILEEALFRGVILNGLARRYGPQSASFWTAVFFAVFHLYNPWQVVPTFFLGLVLAWLVLTTRSLLSSIVVHTMFNAASLSLIRLSLEPSPGGHPVPYVVVVVVLAMLAGSMALLTGMAWLEKQTGGGWFALPPVARSSAAGPRADGRTDSGSSTAAGPTAARG